MYSFSCCHFFTFVLYDEPFIIPLWFHFLVCKIHHAAIFAHCIDRIRSTRTTKTTRTKPLKSFLVTNKKYMSRLKVCVYKIQAWKTKKKTRKSLDCSVRPFCFIVFFPCRTVWYHGIFYAFSLPCWLVLFPSGFGLRHSFEMRCIILVLFTTVSAHQSEETVMRTRQGCLWRGERWPRHPGRLWNWRNVKRRQRERKRERKKYEEKNGKQKT